MSTWEDVGEALLGSWPGTVVGWGRDGIDAYLVVLQKRGLTADDTLRAILTWPAGSDFPPSAPNLAAQALEDPSVPTFDEAWQLIRVCLAARTQVRKAIWEPGEREGLNEQAMRDRSLEPDIHPLVASFVDRQGGPLRLRSLGLDDPENQYREARRHELAERWAEHCDVFEGREVAALASGRRGEGLGRLDPLSVLGGKAERPQIGAGT